MFLFFSVARLSANVTPITSTLCSDVKLLTSSYVRNAVKANSATWGAVASRVSVVFCQHLKIKMHKWTVGPITLCITIVTTFFHITSYDNFAPISRLVYVVMKIIFLLTVTVIG